MLNVGAMCEDEAGAGALLPRDALFKFSLILRAKGDSFMFAAAAVALVDFTLGIAFRRLDRIFDLALDLIRDFVLDLTFSNRRRPVDWRVSAS